MSLSQRAISFNNNIKKAYNENIQNISKIAEICQEHNIEFIIVTFPHYRTFIEKVNEKGIMDMDCFINDIKKKYPIKYYNYFNDNRFNENDFFNSSHLSHEGAIKFTEIFSKDINNR